jgi:hypothetical protein
VRQNPDGYRNGRDKSPLTAINKTEAPPPTKWTCCNNSTTSVHPESESVRNSLATRLIKAPRVKNGPPSTAQSNESIGMHVRKHRHGPPRCWHHSE